LLPHIIRKIGLQCHNIRISAALLTHCSKFFRILDGNNAAKGSEMSYFFESLCPCMYHNNEWHRGARSASQEDLLLFLSLKERVMNCLREESKFLLGNASSTKAALTTQSLVVNVCAISF